MRDIFAQVEEMEVAGGGSATVHSLDALLDDLDNDESDLRPLPTPQINI